MVKRANGLALVALLASGVVLCRVAILGQGGSSEYPYSIPDRGALSLVTDGRDAPTMAVTYARIQPSTGLAPEGYGIFGFRNSAGVMISETSVSTTPLISSGRVFVTYTTGILDTGVAVANPSDEDVQIDFFFSDQRREGTDFGAGSFTLGPGEQLARLISQAPFSAETGTRGALTLVATRPVAVIAVSIRFADDGDIVLAGMPVGSLTPTLVDWIFLPHFIFGGPWSTRIILVNPTDEVITGRMGFISQGSVTPAIPGQTTAITLNGVSQRIHSYSLEPRGFAEFATTGLSLVATAGSFRIRPDEGSPAPIAQSVISNVGDDLLTVSEAVVPPSETGTAFRIYVEYSGEALAPGSIQSGMAIASVPFEPTLDETHVTLELNRLDGSLVGVEELVVPPSGQRAFFANEIFDSTVLAPPFKGVLRITADDRITMMGLRLRTNDRGELLITTTPPANESGEATTAERFFPHLVSGKGWTTETILFTGVAGQGVEGVMRFFGVDGSPFNIVLQ